MRGLGLRGMFAAVLTLVCSVGAVMRSTVLGALERVLEVSALLFGGTPGVRLHNTFTPNLGMQRVQVSAFQRRQGESARRARYRRQAYNAFGPSALA